MFERNITGIVILVMQSFPVCCPRMSRQAAIIAKPSNNSGHVVIRPSSILHFTALSCYRDYYTKTFGAYSCGSSPAERNKQPPWQQQRQGRTFSSLLPSCYYCLSALVAAQRMHRGNASVPDPSGMIPSVDDGYCWLRRLLHILLQQVGMIRTLG